MLLIQNIANDRSKEPSVATLIRQLSLQFPEKVDFAVGRRPNELVVMNVLVLIVGQSSV